MLTGCITEADSLIGLGHLPTAVADFMRIRAYIAASDAYRFADYMAMRAKRQLGFGSADILPAASTVLDTPMAASFPTAPQIIIASLPQGTRRNASRLLTTYTKLRRSKAASESYLSAPLSIPLTMPMILPMVRPV